MELSAGIQASLAGRYASALFELASEQGFVTAVESDLDTLADALRESPELLGGLVVTFGSKRIDGSIRSRLNSLAQAMKG